MSRPARFEVRVTKGQLRRWRAMARDLGVPLGSMVRFVIDAEIVEWWREIDAHPATRREILDEIAKCVMINDAAHAPKRRGGPR